MNNVLEFDSILKAFNIKASCVDYHEVDNYCYYDLRLKTNARVKDVQKYSDEISLALKSPCKPSIKIIHQEGVVRLEFASARTKPLSLFHYFSYSMAPKTGEINCLLGQTVDGHRMWMDLAQNPHLLIAGTTGSGKSTLVHTIIANLLKYNEVELFLVDPKRIEFSEYEKNIKSIPVVFTYEESLELLNNLIEVMEDRYERIRLGADMRDIRPIVLIIDEFSDLILQDKDFLFYNALCRLSQKCRAAKIHLILSTQRPSVNVINGTIKANFPARIGCRVASHIDSKVILDSSGAENLLGKGDALLRDSFRQLERFQIAYTTPTEVCRFFGDDSADLGIF